MLEDYQLIWRLRRGDKKALREVYSKYKDNVYTMAMAILNDSAAAQDILHDAFVRFAGFAPLFGLHRSVNTYLAECVIERSSEILRSKMYKVEDVLRTRNKSPDDTVSADQATEQQHIAAVMEAMMEVPLPQREAVALHLYGQLSFREIAQARQVTLTTAQSRYNYGLEKLAGILDRQVET